MSIVDAVETLSSIADLDFEADIGVTKKHKIVIQDKEVSYRTVHWMSEGDVPTTVRAVRNTFRTVLNYIRKFYRREHADGGIPDTETLEGVKNIMVLVGEAAKKLDRYTGLFKQHKVGSVRNVREFKQLQNFYLNKIAKEKEEKSTMQELFAERVLPISEKALEKQKKGGKSPLGPRMSVVDVEGVKRDLEYELFYLRKENGTRFYDERLLRNMRLICDFGERFSNRGLEDHMASAELWEDKAFHTDACNVLEAIEQPMETFYKTAMKFRERELVTLLNKACMALMLAANPKHQLRNSPAKHSKRYFHDFQNYLRQAVRSHEYERLLQYKSKRTGDLEETMLSLIYTATRALFTRLQGHRELDPVIQLLVKQEMGGKAGSQGLAKALRERDMAIRSVVARHPNGPLNKILDSLEKKKRYRKFDTISQDNLPNQLFELYTNDHKCVHIRLPSPTIQEHVQKAEVSPEFETFIRAYGASKLKRKHLIINLQDRTTWHGHARSSALERMQEVTPYSKDLVVITLPKDTEFYHQAGNYADHDEADWFIQQLIDHTRSDASGYHVPEKYKESILGGFVDAICPVIHSTFFDGRKSLSRRERLDFIEIFYLFLQMKVIDVVSPDSFSLTCKDGIDKGPTASAQLYAFLHLVTDHPTGKKDLDFLDLTLFGPAMVVRERAVSPERFDRMLSVLELIEAKAKEVGETKFTKELSKSLQGLYAHALSQAKVTLPR